MSLYPIDLVINIAGPIDKKGNLPLNVLIRNISENYISGNLLLTNDTFENFHPFTTIIDNIILQPQDTIQQVVTSSIFCLAFMVVKESNASKTCYRFEASLSAQGEACIESDYLVLSKKTGISTSPKLHLLISSLYKNNIQIDFCAEKNAIVYRNRFSHSQSYDKTLAQACIDICLSVSLSICPNIGIKLPPGFDQYIKIDGYDPKTTSQSMYAYIFWSLEGKYACLAFTGTTNASEWLSNFDYTQVAPTQINDYQHGMLVHRGFYNIYLSIRFQLWYWFNLNKFWCEHFFITGHSLGGALSTIAAYDFSNFNGLIHYSLGAPRSINPVFADFFNRKVKTSIRINNIRDPITNLPPYLIDNLEYEDVGCNVAFDAKLSTFSDNHIKAYVDMLP